MRFAAILAFLLANFSILAASSNTPTPTKRSSGFISTADGKFTVNGSTFTFIGANAYWLSSLTDDDDITNTLKSMAAEGIKVVRVWAFNDVDTVPTDNSVWFQTFENGALKVNDGSNGLLRLDKVLQIAEEFGIYIILALTNNWNPEPSSTKLSKRQAGGSRLSNSYGGMDFYVRHLGDSQYHSEFFTNPTIVAAFTDYTTQIASRYANSQSLMSYELANDARCASDLPASPSCTTETLTRWNAQLSEHLVTIDPNHLISSGTQGFLCTDCTKLFPVDAPTPSPAVTRKRTMPMLTKARLLRERAQRRKRNLAKRLAEERQTGKKVRGRWSSSETKRQSSSAAGPGYDGSQGVDSGDISNIPSVGFATFQFFPDQDTYGVADSSLSPSENVIQEGIEWIQKQGEMAQTLKKPATLLAFGLVTEDNAEYFVPFNATSGSAPSTTGQTFATNEQQQDAYQKWAAAAKDSGVSGMILYQWGQELSTGSSPNDGYHTSSGITNLASSFETHI